MHCYECKWPKLQRTRTGQRSCPRCGANASQETEAGKPSKDGPSNVAKIYTGVLAIWGLVMPFLVPIIIKISLANP